MVEISPEMFAGLDSLRVSNDTLSLWVTRSVGPRIIGLSIRGSENLLAVLPHERFTHTDGRVFSFRGGHRLWTAPEVPGITYLPDDRPVDVEETANGLRVVQPVDEVSGLQKTLTVNFSGGENQIWIDHAIRNAGNQATTLAAWAITQLRPGGVGILPQQTEITDPHGLQPNRCLALWPYTDVQSPHFTAGNRYLLVKAAFRAGAFKVGFANFTGWLAYLNEDTLFVKKADYLTGQTYPDFGSSSQCFCNENFLELETLSPLTRLSPGESIFHRETWLVFDRVDLTLDSTTFEDQLDRLVEGLGDFNGAAA